MKDDHSWRIDYLFCLVSFVKSMNNIQLFFARSAHDEFEELRRLARARIDCLTERELKSSDAGTIEDILDSLGLNQIAIRTDNLTSSPSSAKVKRRDLPQGPVRFGNQEELVSVPVLQIRMAFAGDRRWLSVRPTSYRLTPPVAFEVGEEICFLVPTDHFDDQSCMNLVTRNINLVNEFVGSLNSEIARCRQDLRCELESQLARRKTGVSRAEHVAAILGIKLEERNLVHPYSERVVIKSSVKPEIKDQKVDPAPFLAEESFERILVLLARWSEAMERSGPLLSKLKEEEIRAIILGLLAITHEALPTGETFNKGGKTDIFLSVKGGAVFLAECKIWSGECALRLAISQLLGYCTWRDTKAALLVFSRNLRFSKVFESARRAAESHEFFQGFLGRDSPNSFMASFASHGAKAPRVQIAFIVVDASAK